MNNRDQNNMRKKPLAAAVRSASFSALVLGSGAVFSTGSAFAQEEGDITLEEVVVTGSYSKSLEQAADLKRANVSFSDSIVATDIADFPEQNLAEALQRMPGVTIERNKGLGTRVNIRALPSQFTHTSINGIATASGSGGRDVEFDVFASEIIQSVTVKKSPTAADEEGGIAGTVMINTARPFDYDDRKLIVSAEGAHNSISEEIDPKFSFLASDTFGDWGALVSFSSSKRTNRTDANSEVEFRPLSRWLEKSGSDSKQAQSDQAAAVLQRDTGIEINDRFNEDETGRVVFMNKVGDRIYVNEQEKYGATTSLQYKPSETFSLTFDGMVGGYDTVEDEYDAAAYSASSSSTLETIHAYDSTTLSDHGITVLTDTSYANTQHEILSKERINETKYSQFSIDLDWEVVGWNVGALLGYSGAEKDSDNSNLKHTAYAPSRSRYTSTGGEVIPSDNPATIDMYNSPGAYNFEYYAVGMEEVSDDKYAFQLDFEKALELDFLPALSTVQFGLRYTDKSKTRNQGGRDVNGPGDNDVSWSSGRRMDESELKSVTSIVPGGSYGPADLDWLQVPNSYARDFFRYPGFSIDFAENSFYQVDEETTALYLMTDFEFDVATLPVFINAGVRAVETDVLSYGFHQVQNADGSNGYTDEPVSKAGNYRDVLPAINMTIELTDDLLIRAAASETLMRPALGDIAYKREVSLNDFKYRDGNPDLKPTYAEQWEVGVEWYLEEGGIFAASYFKKTIEGVVREELTGLVKDVEKLNADGSLDGFYDFEVYQKLNAEGSYTVSGVELVAQFPFSMIHPSLEGFGLNSNYTMLDTSLTGDSDLGVPTPPVGLADKTYNATFYYDNEVFDARISYNYKDKYVEYVDRDMYPVYRDAYGQTDISIGYKITEDIKVSLKGINITDEETTGYTMDPAFPSKYEFSGRRISLGVRANF
jgi:iron complex outermembrane recepter protein